MEMYRQGDILIRRVDNSRVFQSGLRKKVEPDEDGKLVIAEGEVTGHVHSVPAQTSDGIVNELYSGWSRNTADEVDMYLRVTGGSTNLEHHTHDTITIPEGEWQIVRQREYDPVKSRTVSD